MSIQAYQNDAKHIWVVVDKLTTMEPYLSKHKLREYDNILMQNTILRTKQKSMELHASNVDEWWNLVFYKKLYKACLINIE
jgi:hypothetical protein